MISHFRYLAEHYPHGHHPSGGDRKKGVVDLRLLSANSTLEGFRQLFIIELGEDQPIFTKTGYMNLHVSRGNRKTGITRRKLV